MSNEFNVTKVWSDSHLVELFVYAKTNCISSSIKFYTNNEMILKTAHALSEWFPRAIGDNIEFKFGDNEESYIGYLFIKFEMIDLRGRIKFSIDLINNTCGNDSYCKDDIGNNDSICK